MRLFARLFWISVFGLACRDPSAELKTQIQALEAERDRLAQDNLALADRLEACQLDPKAAEERSQNLFEEMEAAQRAWDAETARLRSQKLTEYFPNSRQARVLRRRVEELDVFGLPEAALDVERWFIEPQGEASVTVLYFFEEWCPFCREELPTFQEKYETLAASGVQIVGLTQINRTATPEAVERLLRDNAVTFPVAQVSGDAVWAHYRVSGLPAAAVIVDDTVAWRGHPRQLDWTRVAALGKSTP